MSEPTTLLEAVRHFSDLDVDYMVRIKWPEGGPRCPKCGTDRVGAIPSRRKFQCRVYGCRKQFSVKTDTIFEDSPLGLDKWFVAVWLIANTKNGTSSCELARALGVTQKTAWFMLHRIRLAMRTGSFRKLSGVVESDETFVGGRAANMHKEKRERKILGRGSVGKAIVHGLLEVCNGRSETTNGRQGIRRADAQARSGAEKGSRRGGTPIRATEKETEKVMSVRPIQAVVIMDASSM